MLPKENVKIEKKEAKNGVMVNRGLSEHLLLQNLTFVLRARVLVIVGTFSSSPVRLLASCFICDRAVLSCYHCGMTARCYYGLE